MENIIVALITGVLSLVGLSLIHISAVYKHLKKPVDDVQEGLSDIGESMADFYDGLDVYKRQRHIRPADRYGGAALLLYDSSPEKEREAGR